MRPFEREGGNEDEGEKQSQRYSGKFDNIFRIADGSITVRTEDGQIVYHTLAYCNLLIFL